MGSSILYSKVVRLENNIFCVIALTFYPKLTASEEVWVLTFEEFLLFYDEGINEGRLP